MQVNNRIFNKLRDLISRRSLERQKNTFVYLLVNVIMIPFGLLWSFFYFIFDELILSLYHLSFSLIYSILFLVSINTNLSFKWARFLLISISFAYISIVVLLLGVGSGTELYIVLFPFVFGNIFAGYEGREFLFFLITTFLFYSVSVFTISEMGSFLDVSSKVFEAVQVTVMYNLLIVAILFSYVFWKQSGSLYRKIVTEKQNSERLLLNILPNKIAERLKTGESPIVDKYSNITIMFADIVNFTNLTKSLSPTDLVNLLDRIFSDLDDLAEKYGLEKIKTIGDEYMVVGGLNKIDESHCNKVANMALEINEILSSKKYQKHKLQLRIGMHSGVAIAGIIGKKKFSYDLWGETVNLASRFESHGSPGKIHISESSYKLLKNKFHIKDNGTILLKNHGRMKSFFLEGKL